MKMKMIRDWIGDLFENGIGETDEDENGLRCFQTMIGEGIEIISKDAVFRAFFTSASALFQLRINLNC